MAQGSNGVTFFWSTSTAQSSAQQMGEVTDFSGPSGSSPAIDITHLGTTDAHQKIMGLVDEGQLSLTFNYNPTDVGQVALRADRLTRTKRKALIKMGDTATNAMVFKGFCSQFNPSGAVDNKISANCVLEITGAVTYTTA